MKETKVGKKGQEVHVCRGLNECRGKGKDGSGTMPGDGQCATAAPHHCAGHNECKGQGGCGVGPGSVQEHPGENECRGQGGCAVPITENVATEGRHRGKPVWEIARALFEKRMKAKGKDVAPAPPPEEQDG
jgi:hypothetical protein